jgi:integrase
VRSGKRKRRCVTDPDNPACTESDIRFIPLTKSQFHITKDTHQPPKSPFWIACYNGIGSDGRVQRFKRSTKTTDRKLAQRLADEWEAAAKLAGQGRLTESHCRKVISEMYETAVGEPLHFRSCRDYLIEWLEGTKANVEARTYSKYYQIVWSFLDHLGAKSERLLREITPTDVRSWRDKLKANGLSAPTVNNSLVVLKSPFKAARDLGYIDVSPCAGLKPLKDEARRVSKDVFTPEQIAALLKAAPSEDWQGMTLLAYFSGLRLRDCSELRWSDIDLDAHTITVETRKTRKTVTLPIHPQLLSWLKNQTRGIGKAPVFPSLTGIPVAGGGGLSMQFKRLMKRAGIKGRLLRESTGAGRSYSSLSFHSLRHSFNAALANAGVDVEMRQELVGHSSLEMNKLYLHPDIEVKRAAVMKVPTIPHVT